MRHEDAQSLPLDVKRVLVAVANSLGDKALLPETLREISGQFAGALEGHTAIITHRPRPPKGTKPRLKAVYTLSIVGSRMDGLWHFSPGQLADLLRNFRKDGVA